MNIKETIQFYLFVLAIILTSVAFSFIERTIISPLIFPQNKNTEIELLKIQDENKQKEINYNKRFEALNSKYQQIISVYSTLEKQVKISNTNFNKIISRTKNRDNEKLKKDTAIINNSDSINRDWFYKRFAKHNNRLPNTADTLITKPSNKRQSESN